MHRNISRSISSVFLPFLPAPLATMIAIAIASLASLGAANSTERVTFSEEVDDQIVPDQVLPIDAFGYLGGLFEARFYQPHSTMDDPRDEIREAASLYGLDLAMMMSIANVESDFNPRVRTGSYKGLFQLLTTSSKSMVTAASGTRGTTLAPPRTCFWFKPRSSDGRLVTIQITPRDTWCISRASKARLNTTHTPTALHGSVHLCDRRGFVEG